MITIITTITDYRLQSSSDSLYRLLHSAANIHGLISLITCSFHVSFHKFTPVDTNTGNMYLCHVLLTKGTVIAVITCDYNNYFA